MGHAHGVGGGLLAGLRIGQVGLCRVCRGYGSVELLLADDVLFDQRLVALQIGLRLGVVGLGLSHAGVRRRQLLLGLRHAGLRAAHIGVGRAQVAAGVDGDDGHIDIGCRGIRPGAGQRGLGVLHRDLVVPGVEVGDRVAGLHHLVLFHVDLGHLAVDARAHLDQVAVDLRVIGILAVGGAPPDAEGNQRHHHNRGHKHAPAAGLRLYDLCLRDWFVWVRC